MKLHLVNFRCYSDKTFEFGDDGLVLITACSGAGKSTILMAIQFALFGTGTKITSYGKTACKVELEFGNMKIVRTKRPNRLILNDDYEDSVAQEIINKTFGDTFDVTGYISQNALNSFIIMSPTDKLEFLEKFAFKNINLSEIKNRCKTLISKRNEELNKTITQLETNINIFNDMDEPREIKFPLSGKSSQYEKITKNEEIRKKNCETLIKKSRILIEKSQKELADLRVLKATIDTKKENISSLEDKLDKIKNDKDNIEYEGDEQLEKYKNILKYILSQKELIYLEDRFGNDKEKLENLKIKEINKLNEELENLKNNIWIEYTENELKNTIKDTKDILKDAKKLTFLKKEVDDYKDISYDEINKEKEKLENLKNEFDEQNKILKIIKDSETIHSCPSCSCKIQIRNNELYLIDNIPTINENIEDVKDNITKLSKEIRSLEKFISDEESKLKRKNKIIKEIDEICSQYEDEINEDSISNDLEYLENYLKAEKTKEKKINKIEETIKEGKFSLFVDLEKDLLTLEKRITEIKKTSTSIYDDDNIMNEEDLRILIIKEEKNKEKLEKIEETTKILLKDKTKYEKQISEIEDKHLTSYKSIKDEEEINLIIRENKNTIIELENKKIEHIDNIEKIKEYNDYILNKEKYNLWKKKIKDLEQKEKEDRQKYTSSQLLKEKLLEAESIAVANVIDSINTHAQIYLDSFFLDNPIVVRLLPFKETKKSNKPQINIEILYKDMECDLNMLSGGELSRVILAFTLALGEMFNTPILLLDESTASLDQEATTLVFDSIKENFKGKMVLIIAHQIIQGVFDKVIKL